MFLVQQSTMTQLTYGEADISVGVIVVLCPAANSVKQRIKFTLSYLLSRGSKGLWAWEGDFL